MFFPCTGINEVSETWGTMKFTVSKYMKGTQERGFVIGAVDEIVQILDDNAMNLQSMSASRFVGPFLETVNKWEKSLSHIGEVVEVKLERYGQNLGGAKWLVHQP
jgi:dynein heavy chain